MATVILPNLGKFTVVPFCTPDLRLTREAARELGIANRILNESTASVFADAVIFLPAGGLAAANVQDALQELDTEKADAATTVLALAGKQPLDATLTALAGVVTAADTLIYATGVDTFTVTPFTAFARALLDDADAPTMRATLGAGTGSGTVTTVSVVAANGFGGSVATPGTTPAITLTTSLTGLLKGNGTALQVATAGTDYVAPNAAIAGATKTKITYDAKGLITAGADATTADIADSLNKRYVTDAQQTVLTNTSGTNTGDQFTATTATRLLGRGSAAGAGPAQELTVGAGLSLVGTVLSASGGGTGDVVGPAASAAGDVALFDGVTGKLLKKLAGGTAGQVLQTNGAGTDPTWASTKRMLANVTLGVAGTSLSSGVIPACKFLEVHIYISGYGSSDTASLQFNASGGTAYRYRWLTSAAAATTFAAGLIAASTDRIKVAGVNTARSRRVTAFISNDPSNIEKLVHFSSAMGTNSAATQSSIDLGNGAWISAAATSITRIDLITTGGGNMNAGTQMTLFGWN
jgi:hypothetical protein